MGTKRIYDTSQTSKDLEINWRFHGDYVIEACESMIQHGFIEKPEKVKKTE